MTRSAATAQGTVYYQDGEVQVDGEIASFPDGSYYIADIIKAEFLTYESQFVGINRDYVLPLIGGAVVILGLLASSAREPGFYFIAIVLYIGASVMGFRARRWYKDKRQLYTYTVGLDTQNGTVEAYSSTDKHTIRRMVLAVNRAIDAQSPKSNDSPASGITPAGEPEFSHNAMQGHSALSRSARSQSGKRPSRRPERLSKLRYRR